VVRSISRALAGYARAVASPWAKSGVSAAVAAIFVSLSACTADPAQRGCECGQDDIEEAPGPSPAPERASRPERARGPGTAPTPTPEAASGPRLRILGIAQDGGLPHVACSCERCEAARREPERRGSPVASVAVFAPGGPVWIVDATPDLPAQLDMLADVREGPPGRVDRTPVSGILLTHAHMGHYLGLAHLGFEAASTEATPVHASAKMVDFLAANAPWDQLVRLRNIEPRVAELGVVIELGGGLKAEPLVVPHRGEYTDTLGWYLSGPRRRALYIPDTDPWAKWQTDLDTALAGVDLLLVDGTFYSGEELPGRDLDAIGHPLMTDTMERFAERVAGGLKLWFIHLNHSNPTLDPAASERRELEARGFEIAAVGREFPL
jgi:pyrroloquinoline quinone biosynthesis protein B